MRITRLELQHFRCFESLVLDNLGDRVILAGPNGSGKSSVLEAIAILKEFIATYTSDDALRAISMRSFAGRTPVPAWPEGLPSPIMAGKQSATLTMQLSLNDAELSLTPGALDQAPSVSLRMERNGEITLLSAPPHVARLFQHFDPQSGAGVIDYIHPQRAIGRIRVNSLNLDELSIVRQRQERIELFGGSQRFTVVKQYIVAQQLEFTSGEPNRSFPLLKGAILSVLRSQGVHRLSATGL